MTAIATTQENPQQTLRQALERIRPALEAVLPKHVTAERILKVVLSATARQPALLKCTTQSIVRAVMQAGELGLEVGGLLGEAYLVPFRVKVKDGNSERWEEQATCIPGYKGLIKLARQSGEIATVSARVVYRRDLFKVNLADEEIRHEPDLLNEEQDDEDLVAAYCIIRYRDGAKQVEVMNIRQLLGIRERSKAKDSGPWVTDFSEMCRKTVVRRALKYAPISAELVKRAMEIEAEAEDTDGAHPLPDLVALGEPLEPAAKRIANRVKERTAAKAGPSTEAVAAPISTTGYKHPPAPPIVGPQVDEHDGQEPPPDVELPT